MSSFFPFFLIGTVTVSYLVYNALASEAQLSAGTEGQCSPNGIMKAFIPVNRPAGVNGFSNLMFCINFFIQGIVNRLLDPIRSSMNKLTDITGEMSKQMSVMGEAMSGLKRTMLSAFKAVYEKIYQQFKLVAWLVRRVMKIFLGIFKVYVYIFKIFYALYLFISSMKNMFMQVIGKIQKTIKSIEKGFNKISKAFKKLKVKT